VPDPWYGSPAGFYGTLDAIEAAMPGVLERIRQLQTTSAAVAGEGSRNR
jgi:protein-tyrosine phosphatase